MTRTAKIAIITGTHLVVGTIGALCGVWYVSETLNRGNAMMNNMMLIARYATNVDLQRSQGGDDEYREALRLFLKALDQLQTADDVLGNNKTTLSDKTLTYVSLERLERRLGRHPIADDYMRQAVSLCARIPWKNCEADHLVDLSERLEKNNLFLRSDSAARER